MADIADHKAAVEAAIQAAISDGMFFYVDEATLKVGIGVEEGRWITDRTTTDFDNLEGFQIL